MECAAIVHSSIVKDTSPPKTMVCDDAVYSSVVKDVNDKVKSVVLCYSETVKTDNSLKNYTVETLNVVQNNSDTVETLGSVKTGNLIEQERHCKLHSCCNSCTYCKGIRKRKE